MCYEYTIISRHIFGNNRHLNGKRELNLFPCDCVCAGVNGVDIQIYYNVNVEYVFVAIVTSWTEWKKIVSNAIKIRCSVYVFIHVGLRIPSTLVATMVKIVYYFRGYRRHLSDPCIGSLSKTIAVNGKSGLINSTTKWTSFNHTSVWKWLSIHYSWFSREFCGRQSA